MKGKQLGRSGRPRVSIVGAAAFTMHGNQGDWADFFHPRTGYAVKLSQQLGRASVEPTRCLVLSMSVYPGRGWRDSPMNPCVITDVMARRAISF
jgi:hypothetical protein